MDQEEFSTTHWVKTDAAKASNMKQSETMRFVSRYHRMMLMLPICYIYMYYHHICIRWLSAKVGEKLAGICLVLPLLLWIPTSPSYFNLLFFQSSMFCLAVQCTYSVLYTTQLKFSMQSDCGETRWYMCVSRQCCLIYFWKCCRLNVITNQCWAFYSHMECSGHSFRCVC